MARFEAPLLRYATRQTGSADTARDVVQETFLSLCQADRSKVEPHLAAWLFRVCRNRAIDTHRKDARMESLAPAAEAELVSRQPGPSNVVERKESTSAVLAVIDTLPESQREVLSLRFQGGLSYREISEVTGQTVSNVGVLLHNAVKKVRLELAGTIPTPLAAKAAKGGR